MEKEKIYCFDFDGTLTSNDTLIEFIRYARGTGRMLCGFLLHSPLLVLMKMKLYPNWRAKQRIFTHFFGGMPITEFDSLCHDFAMENQHLFRPEGIAFVQKVVGKGCRTFIVSASIDNWVRPFFSLRGIEGITVLGTRIEVKDGKVTGRLEGNNCYGAEKVLRIHEALTRSPRESSSPTSFSFDRSRYFIEAFGDSRGDREMLAFADKGHYKPFRES